MSKSFNRQREDPQITLLTARILGSRVVPSVVTSNDGSSFIQIKLYTSMKETPSDMELVPHSPDVLFNVGGMYETDFDVFHAVYNGDTGPILQSRDSEARKATVRSMQSTKGLEEFMTRVTSQNGEKWKRVCVLFRTRIFRMIYEIKNLDQLDRMRELEVENLRLKATLDTLDFYQGKMRSIRPETPNEPPPVVEEIETPAPATVPPPLDKVDQTDSGSSRKRKLQPEEQFTITFENPPTVRILHEDIPARPSPAKVAKLIPQKAQTEILEHTSEGFKVKISQNKGGQETEIKTFKTMEAAVEHAERGEGLLESARRPSPVLESIEMQLQAVAAQSKKVQQAALERARLTKIYENNVTQVRATKKIEEEKALSSTSIAAHELTMQSLAAFGKKSRDKFQFDGVSEEGSGSDTDCDQVDAETDLEDEDDLTVGEPYLPGFTI